MKKNLVLTGMMGSGKSTMGKLLSKKLKMQFVDIDNIIEKKHFLSIAQLFETKGEKFFREIEEKESIKFAEKKGLIIALGGGAFMNKNIRNNLKKSSFTIWLHLNSSELFKRTKESKKRPLLNNGSEEDLRKLYEERKKVYSLTDCKINCNSKNKDEIVEEIKKIYEGK